ncbi:DUF86 domain-containing protein [Paraburkholderia sp. A1RO-5L]|uniref:HepT-like ribonuclease domain-containing protein n=1 Tax=unclassified Paraburkholderia TaxID=2615204 RepID=UPI003B98523D
MHGASFTRELRGNTDGCRCRRAKHPDFAAAHPEIPWEAMHGMRNQVSHGYFAVDIDIVWSTVQTSLPDLKHKLSKLKRT